MKYKRILKILSLVIVVAMLIIAVPVTAQTRSVELDPDEGSVGATVTAVGEGFNKSTEDTDRYAILFFSSEEASTLDDIDDDVTIYEVVRDGVYLDTDGEFDIDFTVPAELNDGDDDEDVVAGTYYVYVCHYNLDATIATRIRAVAEFTVIGGDIAIDPDEGPVGTEVEITGEDFAGDEDIEIYYDDDELDIESGDDETESDGEFTTTVLIPESTAGTHTIKVAVGSSESEVEFTVEPEIFLDPTSGNAGAEATVSGTGFARRSDVVVYFNNAGVATDTASSEGSFEATFTVPELDAGIYDVEAEDEDENVDSAKFTVTVSETAQPSPSPTPTPTPAPAPSPTAINISATSGKAGSDLIITGAGFAAGGTVTIKFGDEVLDTVATDAGGIFVAVLKVPAAKAGEHTITISDGTNTNEVTFTLETVPPPIPAPLLPKMGVKAKTPVTFDWEDVTAEAEPATYSLQVATDEDFEEDTIVLEKTGLADSEYTATEAESIALAGREDVYYWRVRAVDATETEGEWTGAGEFSVSKPFSFPQWALYTLMGLGALVLFGVGYWMGRRTAYYYTF
jgi:hypothetical protein